MTADNLVRELNARWGDLGHAVRYGAGGARILLWQLFHVELTYSVDGAEVTARLTAWDRDLTARVPGGARTAASHIDTLLEAVDATVTSLIPERHRAALAHPPLKPGGAGMARTDVATALAARERREQGSDPVVHVDAARLETLIREQWPMADITAVRHTPDVVDFELRPFATNRVVINRGRRRDVGAAPMIDDEALTRPYGWTLWTDDGEPAVRSTIMALDRWLTLTMPDDTVLAAPIAEVS